MASASCDRPKSLQRLVCDVKYPNGNYLIHQFVVALNKCDQPSNSHIEGYIRYALRSFLRVEVSAMRNEGGFTALHLAVMKRDSFMVKMLLSCLPTIDVNATCENGKKGTALHLATAGYYFKSVYPKRWFGKYKRNNTQLDKAAKEDNLETVKVLLEYGANIDAHDDITFTALHYSVMHKRMDMLKLLISKGANVNVENDHSRTPLHEAARHGSLEAVNILLESGANVDAVDGGGSTALHYAALKNDIDIMKLLISKCMNVSIRNLGGFTPMFSAIQCVSVYKEYGASRPPYDIHDQIELVKLFINKGAELNVKTIYGTTPLHAAVKNRCLKTVKVLVESGASVDAEDKYGNTALRIAEGHNFNEIVEYLNCQLAIVKAVDREF